MNGNDQNLKRFEYRTLMSKAHNLGLLRSSIAVVSTTVMCVCGVTVYECVTRCRAVCIVLCV
jgi:hypothetical protein